MSLQSLQAFLETSNILQIIALALSIFNVVSFLWLTLTVWLNGDRRAWIARIGVIGLGLSAFFFFIQALLVSSTWNTSSGLLTTDFLWHLIWLPAIGVPYIWFAIGLHYASLINANWRKRRPMLLITSGTLGLVTFMLLVINQPTFTFTGTLSLLAYGEPLDSSRNFLAPVTLLPILFLFYVTFCAIGPWFTLGRINRLFVVLWKRPRRVLQALIDAFWDDPTDVEVLEEQVLSWHLARPGLFLAAIFMVTLTTSLGVLGVWSLANWFIRRQSAQGDLEPPQIVIHAIPFNLLLLDIFATGAVALIILLIGYSVVRHGVLIERPLPRRGFFEQWRGIVIVATTVALFIALLVHFTHSNLGGLLLITLLATGAYALFTWSSYTAHDRYIALLGPFLRSTNFRHWLNTDLQKTEKSLENLFYHLCQNVLAVKFARLTIMSGPIKRSFSYRWPDSAVIPTAVPSQLSVDTSKSISPPQLVQQNNNGLHARPGRQRMTINGESVICWVLPIYDEFGLVATLSLGPRNDGGIFTDEDMDLAQACGQRILDTLSEHEAMQTVAALLRRRIVDVKLLGAQQRRVLHDEILPQMHLALLGLEATRASLSQVDSMESNRDKLAEAIEQITSAHRKLAAMIRATTPTAPHRLERDGLMHAIHTMLDQDFQHVFDEVEWQVSPETEDYIDEVTPPAIAELIFAAVQEALRNAARHGRGSDVHRRLCLTLKATHQPHLEVIVADDGVGIVPSNVSPTTGTGSGLLTHSALLAIAGGSLTIKSAPGEGVTVRILLPSESLRQL